MISKGRSRAVLIENPWKGKPILPKRMVWTASAVRLYRTCKRKFYWKYILRLDPRALTTPLLVGRWFHEGLQRWYSSRRSRMPLIAEQASSAFSDFVIENVDAFHEDDYEKAMVASMMLRGMLEAYAEYYKEDRKRWRFDRDFVEREFLVDMGDFDYAGAIDVAHDDFIMEHKTSSNISDSYLERLPLDFQVRGYCFGARFGLSIPTKKVIYNVVRKSKLRKRQGESPTEFAKRVYGDYFNRPEFNFHREPLTFHSHHLHDFERELRRVHDEFCWVVSQGDPLDPRTWGINDKACDDYFRMCGYFKLCKDGCDAQDAPFFTQRDSLHQELVDPA